MAYLTNPFGTKPNMKQQAMFLETECSSLEQATDYIMPIAVGAAITGISLGGIMGFVFLYIRYRKNGDGITSRRSCKLSKTSLRQKEQIKILVRTAIPVGMGAILLSITDVIRVHLSIRSQIY